MGGEAKLMQRCPKKEKRKKKRGEPIVLTQQQNKEKRGDNCEGIKKTETGFDNEPLI